MMEEDKSKTSLKIHPEISPGGKTLAIGSALSWFLRGKDTTRRSRGRKIDLRRCKNVPENEGKPLFSLRQGHHRSSSGPALHGEDGAYSPSPQLQEATFWSDELIR